MEDELEVQKKDTWIKSLSSALSFKQYQALSISIKNLDLMAFSQEIIC